MIICLFKVQCKNFKVVLLRSAIQKKKPSLASHAREFHQIIDPLFCFFRDDQAELSLSVRFVRSSLIHFVDSVARIGPSGQCMGDVMLILFLSFVRAAVA